MDERSAPIPDWVTIPFEETMVDLYAASDLVLSRGGALTVSELQATRTPAVIVPLPAGGGYQGRNADDLAAAGGAVVIPQPDDHGVVVQAVADLITDPARLEAMGSVDHAVDHALAARTMADTIVELADA
jgi:UDP-N-acetylglucosamine--N-acetylmuramyl-(pentapeptide) pyrophosphoryl-undecaprenol N-acetylglucosamine transferase